MNRLMRGLIPLAIMIGLWLGLWKLCQWVR